MNLAGTDEDGISKQKLSRNSKVCAACRILPVRLMMILIDFCSARGRPWVLNTNFFWLWMASLAYCFRRVSCFSHDSTAGPTQGFYECCFILVINTRNKQKQKQNTPLNAWSFGDTFCCTFHLSSATRDFFQCVNISNLTSWGGLKEVLRGKAAWNVSIISNKENSYARLLKFVSSRSCFYANIDAIQ